MEFIQAHYVQILMALLALSEVLALIPPIKANSIFQLVVNAIKAIIPSKE